MLEFGLTDRQVEIGKLYMELDSPKLVGEKLGVPSTNVSRTLKAIVSKAKQMRYTPVGVLLDDVADGFSISKYHTGTFMDKDTGEMVEKVRNVTRVRDVDDVYAKFTQAVDELVENYEGMSKYVPKPQGEHNEDLLTTYVYTDSHLGQYSDARETGKEVNTNISIRNNLESLRLMLDSTPNSESCILLDLGDTLHSKDDNARTNSGHALDTDGRHASLYDMVLEMKVQMVEMALAKHKKVKYVIVAGNHSDQVAVYLRSFMAAWFKNNDRFEVERSPALHQYHQHGNTLLGFHHGHTTKMAKLPEIMAVDCQKIFSSTTKRYYLTGHVHSSNVCDSPLCKVESFRNLQNNDAWAVGAGYRGEKEVVAITYSAKYGEKTRNIVSLEEIEE
jgi:hypothetical protein